MTRRTSALVGLASLAILSGGILIGVLAGSSGGRAAQARWSAPGRAPIPAAAVPGSTAIVDPAGRVHVAFVERRHGLSSLREVVREPGGQWSESGPVVAGTPFTISIAGLAADARGDASVIWSYSAERREVLVGSARTATGKWSREQALSRVTSGAPFGQIAIGSDGATTVVGRGLDGPGLWAVRHTTPTGWGVPTRITPPGARTDAPALAVGADGRTQVIALLKTAGRPRVLWSRGADGSGRWGRPMMLPGSGLATDATLAASADGSVVASWVRPTGSGPQRLAATRTASGAWAPPAPLGGPSRQQWGFSAAIAEASGATILWAQWDARPEDRAVSLRSATIARSATTAPRPIESLSLAPSKPSPGAIVIYGAPPVELRAAAGSEPTLMWNATSDVRPEDPAAVSIAMRDPDGSWTEPHLLSTPGRVGYPVAVGAADGRVVAVWLEAAPLGAANAVLVAERG